MDGSTRVIARPRVIVGMATIALVLLACGAATTTQPPIAPSATPVTPASAPASAAPPPSASPPASPSASAQVIESERHRYRVEIPPGWTLTEYDGTWETFDQFGVGVEVPGEDVIDSSELGAFLVMNSMAIPDGMSGADWLAAFDAVVAPALPPDCPGTSVDGALAGEPVMVLEQTCGGMTILGRSLAHAGRGYYFTTVAPTDGDAGPVLEALVESIAFLD